MSVYVTCEDKFRFFGGLKIRSHPRVASLVQFDGVEVHPSDTYSINDISALTFLIIRGTRLGFT